MSNDPLCPAKFVFPRFSVPFVSLLKNAPPSSGRLRDVAGNGTYNGAAELNVGHRDAAKITVVLNGQMRLLVGAGDPDVLERDAAGRLNGIGSAQQPSVAPDLKAIVGRRRHIGAARAEDVDVPERRVTVEEEQVDIGRTIAESVPLEHRVLDDHVGNRGRI